MGFCSIASRIRRHREGGRGRREPPENFYCLRVCVGVANVLKRLHNRLCQSGSLVVGNGSQLGNGVKGRKGASLHLVILPID